MIKIFGNVFQPKIKRIQVKLAEKIRMQRKRPVLNWTSKEKVHTKAYQQDRKVVFNEYTDLTIV